jgi:hypothetical protein
MQLKIHSENLCLAGVSVEKLIGNEAIINNLCETLVYYFIPFLAIGAVYYFRRHPKAPAQTFFITAFIIVNVARAIWQPIVFGFLSRRHTLPLVAFTIFFIPMGLQIISCWLSGKNVWNKLSEREDAQCWFFILMFAGISICGVKLVRMAPLRWEKQGYRDAAIWLNQNTEPNAIIAVPDKRIAFYAERKGQVYSEKIPKRAAYIVTIAGRKEGKEVVFNREIKEVYSTEMSRKKKDEKVVIYHAVSQPSE